MPKRAVYVKRIGYCTDCKSYEECANTSKSPAFGCIIFEKRPAGSKKIKVRPEGWVPSKRGRKPGSTNKPKVATVTEESPVAPA